MGIRGDTPRPREDERSPTERAAVALEQAHDSRLTVGEEDHDLDARLTADEGGVYCGECRRLLFREGEGIVPRFA